MSNTQISTFKRTTINVYVVGYDRMILSVNGSYYIVLPTLYTLGHILRYAAGCKEVATGGYSRKEVSYLKNWDFRHSIVINQNGDVWMDGHQYYTMPEDSPYKILRPTS